MTLSQGNHGERYEISEIKAEEEGMREFLFTLGCYPGEIVTVISRLASNIIINVKDARYSIDESLATAISVTTNIREKELVLEKLA